MKYGASIPLWRRENYIAPFLDQMLSLNIEPVVVLSEIPFVNEGRQEPKEPDRSEEIVRGYFPEVKIIKGFFGHHRESVNAGMKELKHCDIVFVNDCDIFLSKEDWGKCFKFIEDNINESVFRFDFEKICTEYYYDYRYGKPALKGGVPPLMALKSSVEFRSMTHASGGGWGIVWNDPTVMIHHLRFCKGKYGPDDPLYQQPPPDKELCKPAPEEISNLLIKWENTLKLN